MNAEDPLHSREYVARTLNTLVLEAIRQIIESLRWEDDEERGVVSRVLKEAVTIPLPDAAREKLWESLVRLTVQDITSAFMQGIIMASEKS